MRNHVIEEDLAQMTAVDVPWSRFAGKTVLITGASGFLPAYMVETLLFLNEQGQQPPCTILGLVRDRQRAEERFAHYSGNSFLRLLVQDVCEPLHLEGPVDFIIHAASQASPKFYGSDPVGTLMPNSLGTFQLLTLARQKGTAGFLFFSSGEVYGKVAPAVRLLSEDQFGYLDPAKVRSCYAESKRLGETLCVSFNHQYGVPTTIVRPFHTYGPGMRLDDGRVFADFVAAVVGRRDIILTSDGSAMRPFCYLSDAATGFFSVLLKGAVGEAYNVGNDQAEISILELAQLLVNLYPERNLKIVQQAGVTCSGYLPSPVARACPNISKLRQLGWNPSISLEKGFRRTIESFL